MIYSPFQFGVVTAGAVGAGTVTAGIFTVGGFFTMLLRDILLACGRGMTTLTQVHDILTFSVWCSYCWGSRCWYCYCWYIYSWRFLHHVVERHFTGLWQRDDNTYPST